MTTFWLCFAALILFSGLFYLFPRMRPGAAEKDLEKANLEWFRLRQAELTSEGNDSLQEDAQLRLLEDEQLGTPGQKTTSQSFPVWMLLPLVAIVSCGLYYVLGAAPDVLITRQLNSLSESTSEAEMQQLVLSIEARAQQRPDNLPYLGLLGRYYLGQEEYARAAQTYSEILEAVPGDAQALAFAAQADYLAAGNTLSASARLSAEQALAVDPQQRTALGLLGIASFEQAQYRAAIAYWERLLAMEPPDSENGRMIAGVIETARQNLAAAEPGAPDTTTIATTVDTSDVASGAGVSVHVPLPQGADIAASDTVFILARNAEGGSRMPIAVQRLTGAQLPVTVRLDDSNSMAGQKLSEAPSVIVAVQVSPQGRPGEDNATWLGQVGPLSPTDTNQPIEIELRANIR